MKGLSLLIYAAIAISTMQTGAGAISSAPPKRGPLHITADVRFLQDQLFYLSISLRNDSKKVACVENAAFDKINNAIKLWDSNGQAVTPNIAGTPQVDEYHGVNYAQSYDFLFPGTKFSRSVELYGYALKPGVYRFKWLLGYYICRDVVDLERPEPADYIPMYAIAATGRFTVAP